jgi:hypothetical protein
MAQAPTSNSTLLNNAAKDDAIGNDGIFQFSYEQLVAKVLANDPGGANKLADHFFFGASATADQTMDAQISYLTDVAGFTYNAETGVFTIDSTTNDLSYFVQIGNKGTWSQGNVDVTTVAAHSGDLLLNEGFDTYAQLPEGNFQWAAVNLVTNGWQNAGSDTEVMRDGYANVLTGTSGDYMLDTQATSGPINITKGFHDGTGEHALVSFDIAVEDLTSTGNGTTDPNASFSFKIDGTTVETLTVQEILEKAGAANTMAHYDFVVNTGAAGDHTLSLVDGTPLDHASNFGFALDTVQVHDWIV